MYKVLDSKVIAIAVVTKGIDEWTAYIGAVDGINHDLEWQHVADYGSKLYKELAKFLFPEFAEKYRWSD